jgi:hypothetical protein
MYSLQHFDDHSNPLAISFRWASHFFETFKGFILGLIISFDKAVKIAKIASLDSRNYNQETVKRMMFED